MMSIHRKLIGRIANVSCVEMAIALLATIVSATPVSAGLYYSGETYAELPAQWRGFLLDQRLLRQIAAATEPPSPLRSRYLDERKKLEAKPSLTGDEIADLGAILVRLGEIDRAIEVLRGGIAKHPNHFALAANLGTAWQLKGDLAASADSLRQAVRLAPGKHLGAEEFHLRLVQNRLKSKSAGGSLDDLFGVAYFAGERERISEADKKTLTPRSVGLTQQLALWLPADGPLLWQLAELANAFGDVRTAASLTEGCVAQFNMGDRDLRRRRLLFKGEVEKLPALAFGDKTGHKPEHSGSLTFRSRKPLASSDIDAALGPIRPTGINPIPWELLSSTAFEGKFPPRFSSYLKELDGKLVSLNGFMQPMNDEATVYLFIESPVGCWYCEMPDATGMIVLQPPANQPLAYNRSVQRVVGRLVLNATDPEDFLFSLTEARLAPLD